MAILINNSQSKLQIHPETIKKKAKVILNALGCPEGELSILIVDDMQITPLNRQYLQREGPTNVIAFPMREGDFSDITPHLLGDVVISVETAQREGQESGTDMEQRFMQLLVHGILHLFGYDHIDSESDAQQMDEKSSALLTLIDHID
ncbi:MAG: rRNA maturation RNase YbeY [Desulfobacterales bacterium]|nr:rRNA maturation RNase YbeY [Desulfobacterales bacterium]MDD4073458.1 rRNA maturation RNase YbeY [Desulfobacterales bacterium]MDD4392096.1 rRNA maturation RNase YbeY [Desulfobacterales bacterium]